jgi:hypothetical protein
MLQEMANQTLACWETPQITESVYIPDYVDAEDMEERRRKAVAAASGYDYK